MAASRVAVRSRSTCSSSVVSCPGGLRRIWFVDGYFHLAGDDGVRFSVVLFWFRALFCRAVWRGGVPGRGLRRMAVGCSGLSLGGLFARVSLIGMAFSVVSGLARLPRVPSGVRLFRNPELGYELILLCFRRSVQPCRRLRRDWNHWINSKLF
jgi:hypothetical protein